MALLGLFRYVFNVHSTARCSLYYLHTLLIDVFLQKAQFLLKQEHHVLGFIMVSEDDNLTSLKSRIPLLGYMHSMIAF